MKTLKVPERLLDAAYRLMDNKVIYCGLDNKTKELIKLAAKQGVLDCYLEDGCKSITGRYRGDSLHIAYCLPDDIEIVVEQEQTWWEKEGLILCKIEKQVCRSGWEINYPDGNNFYSETFGIPRCKGYEFVGFVHNDRIEKWQDIKDSAFGYFDASGNFWVTMRERDRTPSTATHTVWRKIEVK